MRQDRLRAAIEEFIEDMELLSSDFSEIVTEADELARTTPLLGEERETLLSKIRSIINRAEESG